MQTGTRELIEHEGIRPLEHAQGVPEEDEEPPEEVRQIISC